MWGPKNVIVIECANKPAKKSFVAKVLPKFLTRKYEPPNKPIKFKNKFNPLSQPNCEQISLVSLFSLPL